MKKTIMKNWVNTIIFCILVIVAGFAIYNITHVVLTYVQVDMRIAETIGRLIASVILLVFYRKFFNKDSFGIRSKNFLKGLWIGGYMFVLTLFNLESSIDEVSGFPFVAPSVYLVLIVIVEQLFVGIFEEFLVRGFVLNVLLEKLKNNGFRGKIKAIAISSLLFGLIHFLNLFSEPQMLNATIAQFFYSVFIGVFLGALYLRTGNIWVVAFYHFIYDAASELPAIFREIPVQEMADISITDAVLTAVSSATFLIAGLFIVRKLRD